jgi:hypothetical protein
VRLARYVRSAIRYISYSGSFTVSGDTVTHHIEVSQMPGLLNTDQERSFQIEDNSLLLIARMPTLRQEFAWVRVPAQGAHNILSALRDELQQAQPVSPLAGATKSA